MGVGERHAALPPGAMALTRRPDGSVRAIVNAAPDKVRDSPEFECEGDAGRRAP